MNRPIVFGEVLFDCFPDGSRVLGGAPFNVAWHLQAFGAEPLFVSRVGNDPMGRQIRDAMLQWGMDTSGLQLDSRHPTGTVDVSFIENEPRYEIVEQRAWDFIDAASLPPLPVDGILYHGSLALRNEVSAAALDMIKKTISSAVFVDINLRPPWWQQATIEKALAHSQWIKLNADELAEILPQGCDTSDRIDRLRIKNNLEFLVVTEGEAGALIVMSNGEQQRIVPEKKTTVVDTVGAGDAFASVLLLGQIKKWNIQASIKRAQDFASEVVGHRGATIADPEVYKRFTVAWK
ncbi:MAG: carbohydrate kinase [Thiothrix sp.]|nr:MAG: carbohydrate kinase [Thiothrix sp.]